MERSRSSTNDFEARIVTVSLRLETQWDFAVVRPDLIYGYGLPPVRSIAPDQTYFDGCAGTAGKHDPTCVGFSFTHGQLRLLKSTGFGRAEFHQRRVIAYIRMVRIHGDKLVGADRHPVTESDTPEARPG